MKRLRELLNQIDKRLLLYLVAGFTTYFIEMGVLLIGKKIVHLRDVSAVAVSFWISLGASFTMQKLIVFKNTSKHPKHLSKQAVGYMMLVGFNYLFTLLVVYLFTPRLSVFLVRTAAIGCITLWNYKVYKMLFKNPIT